MNERKEARLWRLAWSSALRERRYVIDVGTRSERRHRERRTDILAKTQAGIYMVGWQFDVR